MRTQNWAIREEQDGAERTRRSGAEYEKNALYELLREFLNIWKKMKNWIKRPLHEVEPVADEVKDGENLLLLFC